MNFSSYRYIYLILFLSLSIFTFSCKRNVYYKVHPDFKDFCVFKENSYWIYQDSASNLIDTVILLSSENNSNIEDEQNYYEYYNFHLVHKTSDTVINITANINTTNNNSTTLNDFSTKLATFEYGNINFIDLSLLSLSYVNNQMKFFSGNFISDVQVNGIHYDEVLVNKITNATGSNKKINVYWVAGVGIIRYEIDANVVKLIKSNVLQ